MNRSESENVTLSLLLEATTTDKPITDDTGLNTPAIIASVAGSITMVLLGISLVIYCFRRKRNFCYDKSNTRNTEEYLEDVLIRKGPYGQDDTITTLPFMDDSAVDTGTDSSEGGNEIEPVVFLPSMQRIFSERTGDGCLETVSEVETINDVYNENVSYSSRTFLALVKAPTRNSGSDLDETIRKAVEETEASDIDNNYLDWNKVFRFLTKHLQASKSRLFFNVLYSHTSMNGTVIVPVVLEQVENDMKQRLCGCDTVTLLLEQFNAWKQLAGRNAKLTCIYDTLKDLEWNDTLAEIRAYMRNPPLLTSDFNTSQNTISQSSQEWHNSIENSAPEETSLQLVPQIGTNTLRSLRPGKYNYRCEISYDVDYRQPNNASKYITRNKPDGALAGLCDQPPQEKLHMPLKQTTGELYPDISAEQCGETKELRDEACSSNIQKQSKLLSSSVKRKGKYLKSNRIKKKTSRKKNAKVKKLRRRKLSKKSFITLVKTLLQSTNLKLKRDMYQIFLRHLISTIVKETRYKENVILSLTCAEVHEYTKSKSSREDVVIMYSGSSMVVLKMSTFEELLFYKDHAREQVVKRLGDNIDQESQKYIFLDYDGKSFLSKETEGDKADETDSDGSSCLTVEESVMSDEEHNDETDVLMSSNSAKDGQDISHKNKGRECD